MSISYDPGVTFRGGELIGAGLERGAQSLSEAIIQHKRDLDEKKGLQLVLKAHAEDPNSGIDPTSIDKMSAGEAKVAILASELRRQQAMNRQQAQRITSLANLGQSVGEAMPNTGAPSPDFVAALMGQGTPNGARGPLANPPMTPGPSPLKVALLNAVQNKDLLFTKEGQEYFGNMLKQATMQPKTPTFTTDPSGRNIAIDPSGRVQWAPGGAGGGKKSAPQTTQLVDPATGKKYGAVWSDETGKFELLPHVAEKAVREPGAGPLMSKDGKFYWDDKDQTWKPHAAKAGLLELVAPAAGAPGNANDPLNLGF